MIVTLTTNVPLKPVVTVHGDMIKCDLGALLIEFDREGFNNFVYEVVHQAIERDINLNLKK